MPHALIHVMVVQDVQISVLDVVHALQHALLLALKDVEDVVVAPVAPDLVLDAVLNVVDSVWVAPMDVDQNVLEDALMVVMEAVWEHAQDLRLQL